MYDRVYRIAGLFIIWITFLAPALLCGITSLQAGGEALSYPQSQFWVLGWYVLGGMYLLFAAGLSIAVIGDMTGKLKVQLMERVPWLAIGLLCFMTVAFCSAFVFFMDFIDFD